jgi:protein gp37
MAQATSIEWTSRTWNPVRGCVKISPECDNCYARRFAERFRGVKGHPYEQGFDPRLAPDQLDAPTRWRKPTTIFVNSMSDLFGKFVPFAYAAACFGVMAATPRHTYQVLTKRAARLLKWSSWIAGFEKEDGPPPTFVCETEAENHGAEIDRLEPPWPLANVHLGVSVGDRKHGLPRIALLRRVPAALRFLSIEPLLEDLGELDLTGIGWVIVGGEAGPGARPFDLALAKRIHAQCVEQKVPFFFKQAGADPVLTRLPEWHEPGWGSWKANAWIGSDKLFHIRLKHRKGADLSELPADLRVREMPRATP